MPNIQLYTQKCIRQIPKCSMHVSNWRVIYKVHAQEYPIIGSETPPVMYMTCLTSQLMNLRPNFVGPPVPCQSDHVIRHMVRYNTEAYANI